MPFKIKVLWTFLRELFGARNLRREPESSLVMEDRNEVAAFAEAGLEQSALNAIYILNAGLISQALGKSQLILDLGCGPATELGYVAQLNPDKRFIGIDLSTNMLMRARSHLTELGVSNVETRRMDMTKLDFADHSVDAVISTLSLHHLPTLEDLRKCFREIKRVLKPGGRVFLMDHGRLKQIQSVLTFSYRDFSIMPYLYNLDSERSIRAAFLPREFGFLAGEFLPPETQFFSTYKVPLYMVLASPPEALSPTQKNLLASWKMKLDVKFQRDLDDIRTFLHLGGMPMDPFARRSAASQPKFLQLGDELCWLHDLIWKTPLRVLRLCRFAFGAAWLRMQFRLGFASKKDTGIGITRLLVKDLGVLKGPLMKIGQMLSYMAREMPGPARNILTSLQDTSPPINEPVIRKIVESELRAPIEKLFKTWWQIPLAAGSISQIHLAQLQSGELVAVKVKYPNIEKVIKTDLCCLRFLSPLGSRLLGISNMKEILGELETLLLEECDLLQAARYQDEFHQRFQSDADIIIPAVHFELTTSKVLTMEFIPGERYNEFRAHASQEEKDKASMIIWRMAAESCMKYGIYNADPHPGNYLFLNGKVCFLDFGFTRRFSQPFVESWKKQAVAYTQNDLRKFSEANQELGFVTDESLFDHASVLKAYRESICKSHLEDRNFTFSEEFVKSEMRSMAKLFRSIQGSRLPVEFVAILRLIWGQHAILADLKASGNWFRAVYPLLTSECEWTDPSVLKQDARVKN